VKDTTDQAETQANQKIQITSESANQTYGYIRLYRPVQWNCGANAAMLYGVLEDLAQLSVRNQRPCMPGYHHLAHTLGLHVNAIKPLLEKLVQGGWLRLSPQPGKPHLYTLLDKNPGAITPPQKLGAHPHRNCVGTHTETVYELERNELEQRKLEKGIAVTDLRAPAQGMRKVPPSPTPVVNLPEERAPESKGTAETKPVSTSPGTSSEERNFYWTGKPHGPTRLAQFEAFWGVYPNQEDRVGAMEHWRKSIAAQLDGATRETPLFIELFMGLQWWKDRKWSSRNPAEPAKWWLRNQRWRDMPASARSVYVAEGEK
jgi:hypothetical protein